MQAAVAKADRAGVFHGIHAAEVLPPREVRAHRRCAGTGLPRAAHHWRHGHPHQIGSGGDLLHRGLDAVAGRCSGIRSAKTGPSAQMGAVSQPNSLRRNRLDSLAFLIQTVFIKLGTPCKVLVGRIGRPSCRSLPLRRRCLSIREGHVLFQPTLNLGKFSSRCVPRSFQ